ncbi:MAG: tatB [Caulobacteraceae bacterium]|jgi:sec-independent protein translocase protein TatB|nr:tatB [Caulobacteraceae bacterium]
MLPDLSPAHILIVVVVALIVVGPKDLPMLLRKIGQFMGKMRGMANEFRASFDEMARQSELDELRKEVEAMRVAASAATPDLGLTEALKTDAEGAYMDQWQASQAAAEAYVPPEQTILPPAKPDTAEPAKASKPRSKAAKSGEPAAQSEAAAPAKARARKAKRAAETGS